MSLSPPKISVLMAVYNGSRYIAEAIDSVLNQTFTDFEFLIIEDGSTDNTLQILQDYANRDSRIKLIQNEQNIGLTKSLNKGLSLAQGKYIARQDADDVSLPHRFEQQVAVFEQNPAAVLVSCSLELIDATGKTVGKQLRQNCQLHHIAWYLLFYNYLAGHSQVMFAKQPALELGGYCEQRRYSQDYELWCRLIQVGEVVILPDILLQHRMHDQRVSMTKQSEQQALSLAQSQRNIASLIGESPSLEEVTDLRGLMLIPNYWYAFTELRLPARRAAAMHRRLQQIYAAFIQKMEHDSVPSDLALQIRSLISKQFLCWMQHLSLKQSLFLKLRVLFYAWQWSPNQVLAARRQILPFSLAKSRF